MPKRVKEPVQVYLDRTDRALLDRLAEQTGLSRAELLRRGIRHIAAGYDKGPFHYLIGILDDPDAPTDGSVNHDKYLNADLEKQLQRRIMP